MHWRDKENRKLGALRLLNKEHDILIIFGEYHADVIPKGSTFKIKNHKLVIRGEINMTVHIDYMTDVKLFVNNDESIMYEKWDLSFLKPQKRAIMEG